MHLRVTTESDTYVYATSPLRLAGLDPEDFIILALPVAVLNTVDVKPHQSVCWWGVLLLVALQEHDRRSAVRVLVHCRIARSG